MMRTYKEVRRQWEILWAIGAASDMTGGYVDQEDLDRLLENPTKATATHCMERQIDYWFSIGTEDGGTQARDDAIANDPEVASIAEDHGHI